MPKSTITTGALALGIPLLLILSTVLSMHYFGQREHRREYDRLWHRYLDAGGPATLADLAPDPVPDEDNAATLYRKALTSDGEWRFGNDEIDGSRLSDTTLGLDPDNQFTQAEIEHLLTRFSSELDLVERGAMRAACVWRDDIFDVETLFDVRFDWLQPATTAGRMLCLRARHEFKTGNHEAAERSIIATLQLAEHLSDPPFLITLLMRSSLQHSVLSKVKHMYRDSELPGKALMQAVESLNPRRGGREMMLSEAHLAITPEDQLRELVGVDELPTGGLLFGWNEYRDRALVLDMMLHNSELIEVQPAERGDVFREDVHESWSVLARLLVPPISSYDRQLSQVEARRQLALTAFALRGHYLEHGEHPDPESWDIPRDAVTGHPMHYERTDDGGFILRSNSEFRIRKGDEWRTEPLEWEWPAPRTDN